jgi:hypothetical protein
VRARCRLGLRRDRTDGNARRKAPAATSRPSASTATASGVPGSVEPTREASAPLASVTAQPGERRGRPGARRTTRRSRAPSGRETVRGADRAPTRTSLALDDYERPRPRRASGSRRREEAGSRPVGPKGPGKRWACGGRGPAVGSDGHELEVTPSGALPRTSRPGPGVVAFQRQDRCRACRLPSALVGSDLTRVCSKPCALPSPRSGVERSLGKTNAGSESSARRRLSA